MKLKGLTSGTKVVTAYLAIEYLVPFILNLNFDTEPIFRTPLHIERVTTTLAALLVLSFIAVALAGATPTIRPRRATPIKPLPYWVPALLAVLAIAVGVYVQNSNLMQWRYSQTSLAQQPDLIGVAIAQMILPVLVFWLILTDQALLLDRRFKALALRLALVVALVLSINGLGAAFRTLFLGLALFLPRQFLPLFFSGANSASVTFSRARNLLVLGLVLAILAQQFIILGKTAKTGQSEFAAQAIAGHLEPTYLVNRHSIHMASLAASIEDGPDYSNIDIIRRSFAYRVGILMGWTSPDSKPEISSYMRKAALQFKDFPIPKLSRMGSSPGVLATFTMSFPMVFAAAGIFVYLFGLVKLLDFVLCLQPRISWMGAMALAYFPLRLITDSPFDMIVPGPVLVTLGLVAMAASRRGPMERAESAERRLLRLH